MKYIKGDLLRGIEDRVEFYSKDGSLDRVEHYSSHDASHGEPDRIDFYHGAKP